jgi:hypothetical protein
LALLKKAKDQYHRFQRFSISAVGCQSEVAANNSSVKKYSLVLIWIEISCSMQWLILALDNPFVFLEDDE